MTVPLFDALAHPTNTGKWLGRDVDATFEQLAVDLEAANFAGACAVGLAGQDGYEHAEFAAHCRRYPQLVPVAGFSPFSADIESELDTVAELGFRGIKIHPRFSGVSVERNCAILGQTLAAAEARNLVTFFCTYQHAGIKSYPTVDPLHSLVQVLQQAPTAPVVLVHGGDVRVLQYAELVRHNPHLLLDLSLTLMKYKGSSVDADLRFLFAQFDRRICIGTDHPEYSHQAVRARFEHFSEGISAEKQHNIAHRNIMRFLGLPPIEQPA